MSNKGLALIGGVALIVAGGILRYGQGRRRNWATMISYVLLGLGDATVLVAVFLLR